MIAKRTGVSAGKVSDAMAKLRALKIASAKTIEVAQSQGGKRWVVTFHFDVWERQPQSSGDQVPGHQVTNPGHVVTATTALQKEEQLELSSSTPAVACLHPDRFDDFLRSYGNLAGTGPKKAKECWNTAMKRGDDPNAIIAGLEAWVIYWRTPGANKAMYAQGFLNQQKWAIEPPPLHADKRTATQVGNDMANGIVKEETLQFIETLAAIGETK
jgi:hypothetical protein